MTQEPESKAHPADGTVVEPMSALARFPFDWADTLCDDDHGCADYHRMWSMVRFLESGGALPEGGAFFDTELPRVSQDGVARVIISGGADTGVMTLVVNACRRAGIIPEITMIDRCATPITQCRLFARQIGVTFQAVQGTLDQLDVRPADAIVAHSFMPFLPPEAWTDLFQSWSRNLRPGGKVLMSQRLVPPGTTYDKKFTPEEIRERRESIAAAFQRTRPVDVPVEDFLAAAERLWFHKLSGRGVFEQDIEMCCAQSSLTVEKIVYETNQSSVSPTAPRSHTAMRKRAGIALIKTA